MLHTTIKDAVDNPYVKTVDETKLPKVDYLALSHLHINYQKENRVYTGPTFPNNISELEELKQGSFYIFDNGNIRKQKIPSNEIYQLNLEIKNALTITDEIIELIKSQDVKNKIVIIRLTGTLEKGKISDINFKKIENFLKEKDPEKTDELLKSIQHSGQDQPAIITCDGFLINGNRRKLVFEMLLEEFPGNEKYKRLKVVILPGKGEPGGPPTKIEIEALENRYQYQSDGKAEYYAFDKAISMRQKIEMGFSLQAQLGDDPRYALLSPSQIKKIVKEYENDLIKPLECIDRYLSSLGRDGLYKTISTGFGDPEGRWQAFYDYSKSNFAKLSDERKRVKLGIKETEVGKIEDASFKIIRKRDLGDGSPKVHHIMREIHKWVENEDAKNELLELSNMNFALNKKD
ncbi:MAG: hypothetical protein IIB27_02330, partial [Chloroflexi bacterium]|nr:hypothetical protein [Chloroflexota bacterium]